MKIVPVILAGGVGERFWPVSRSKRPKQLIPVAGKRSLIEETLVRARPFCVSGVRPVIVTGRHIAAPMRRILPSSVKYDVIVEPAGKNTAPAVAAAAAWILEKYDDAVMLVLSADHSIRPVRDFVAAARFAARIADRGNNLCVFGITPSRPDTGYGYIHLGKKHSSENGLHSYEARRFVEKPGEALAKSYASSECYMWNSGMFVWKASVIMEEFEKHMPELFRLGSRLAAGGVTPSALNAFYRACVKESIDYGIMEKSSRVIAVVPAFEWDDVGSWEAAARIRGCDSEGNTLAGKQIFSGDSRDTIVFNDSGLTVAACGLKGMVVVATKDAVLVIPREKLAGIRGYISVMKSGRAFPSGIF